MRSKVTQILLFVISGTISCFGQGFINLGFESANVQSLSPGQVEIVFTSNAVPGWSVFRNSSPVIDGIHNGFSAGSAQFSILGPFYQPQSLILDGSFTLVLMSSALGNADMSIEQTGLIPANSQSLQFKALGALSGLGVSVNGSSLSPVTLSTTPNYSVMGVDISPFANQTMDLRFTSFAPASGVRQIALDAVQFSANPVPEPSAWALLALGGALFWCVARRRGK